jgi:fatty-acyl-CoA synthase
MSSAADSADLPETQSMQDQEAGGPESCSCGNPGDDGGRARFQQRLAAAEAARGDRDFLTLVEADGQTLTFTYPMLRENAAAWAERYRGAGLVAGERIVIILNHSPALYASYLGALLGGYCPAFFAPPSEKTAQADYARSVGQLLAQTGAEIVVTDHDLRRRLGNEIGWFRGFTEAGAFCEMGSPPPRPAADQSAPYLFLQFSSGTTGIKKGVGISAAKLLWQVDAYAKELEIGPDARIATWLPLYHDMGLITCYFLPLLLGIPMIAVSPFDWVRQPAILLDMISLTRATHCWLPNFAFNFLATRLPQSEMRDWDLGCIEALVNCSEPIHAESHRLFLDRLAPHGIRPAMIRTCYAMAETTFAVTSSASLADGPLTEIVDPNTLNRDLLVKTVAGTGRPTVTSGRALPGIDIRILSTLNAPLPEGHLGEIAVRSPSRFDGYLANRDAGADLQSHFSTGDLGYMRNGELFVVGRIKDTIIIGGKNIYPQDIEAVCNEVEGVRPGRCVAFGVDNPELGTENLIVIVEAMSDEAASREKVRARLFQAIVARTDATPADVIAVPHMYLRKSTSGKISRSKNRETYRQASAPESRRGNRRRRRNHRSCSQACPGNRRRAGQYRPSPDRGRHAAANPRLDRFFFFHDAAAAG